MALIRTRAYYVPQAGVRLFCPQNYDLEQNRQDEGVGQFSGTGTSIRFTDEYLNELEFPFSPNIRLPLMSLDNTIPETGLSETLLMNLSYVKSDNDTMSLLNEANTNLTAPQKELLLWHQRLSHAGFAWNQDLMRSGKHKVGGTSTPPFIPTKHTTTC